MRKASKHAKSVRTPSLLNLSRSGRRPLWSRETAQKLLNIRFFVEGPCSIEEFVEACRKEGELHERPSDQSLWRLVTGRYLPDLTDPYGNPVDWDSAKLGFRRGSKRAGEEEFSGMSNRMRAQARVIAAQLRREIAGHLVREAGVVQVRLEAVLRAQLESFARRLEALEQTPARAAVAFSKPQNIEPKEERT